MRVFAEMESTSMQLRPVGRRISVSPLLTLQRSAGNSAVAALVQDRSQAQSGHVAAPADLLALQRCGSTPPDQCPCRDGSQQLQHSEPDEYQETSSQHDHLSSEENPPVLQRACVATGDGQKRWKYEYDGCSLPAAYAISFGGLTLGGAAKDNPAGGEGTAFALAKPTTEGGVACDRHDECYQSCGTKKDECDQRMYSDMKEICATAPMALRQRCATAAILYYNGLKRLPQAQAAYDDRQKSACACDPNQAQPAERFPPRELLRSPKTGAYLDWLAYQLILPRLAGYRVFRRAEQYEAYIHPELAPSVRTPANDHVPRNLRMR